MAQGCRTPARIGRSDRLLPSQQHEGDRV